jgi:hypothetical protein
MRREETEGISVWTGMVRKGVVGDSTWGATKVKTPPKKDGLESCRRSGASQINDEVQRHLHQWSADHGEATRHAEP